MTSADDTRGNGETPPIRIAFVGQGVYFSQCSLEHAAGGLDPVFLDFRAAAPPEPLLARLEAHDPDVVFVFRPEIIPDGLFHSLRALTIGYLTEPLPRTNGVDDADLRARLWSLEQVDATNFDRIISFDPLIVDTVESHLTVWRSVPIPVADSFFMDVHERARPPGLLFIGRSTDYREELLAPLKGSHPIVHIGHGLYADRLKRFLRRADVQLNLHNNPYPTFENRVCLALAAGHLVISQPLSPLHELRPGIDHLEANTPAEMLDLVERIARELDVFADVQAAGRRQAERFRASQVYPQLARDVVADVAERGSERRRS